MSLYPVTKQMIWQMIENERQRPDGFTLQGAIASYLYDLITGTEMSQRNYCKVWGWSHKKVRLNWEQITSTAALMHANEQGHTRGTTGAQKEAKSAQNEGVRAHEGHTRGTHLLNTTNYTTKNSANLAGGGKPQDRAQAREESAPAPVAEEPSVSVEWDLSWLPANDRVYAPTIAEKLDLYKPSSGDYLLTHLWRSKSSPPTSSIAKLLAEYPWPVFVAAAVITAGERNPNLKLFDAILQRLNHEHSRANESTPIAAGSDAAGGGALIYDLTGHAGGAVPGGVRPGRNGSPQPAGRREGAFKHPSQRSLYEHYRSCGWSDDEIAALHSDSAAGNVPAGGSNSGAGGGEIAHRPLLRIGA